MENAQNRLTIAPHGRRGIASNRAMTAGQGLVWAALMLLCLVEPALANKFETIGGGVAGSSGVKREWLQQFFLVVGGVATLGALLAVVIPHANPLYLNFTNWKASSIVLAVIAVATFIAAALL